MIFAETDIDKILEIIRKKVLKGTHLLVDNERNTGWISEQLIF